MNKIMWQPSQQAIEQTQMYAFMQYVNNIHTTAHQNYADLYSWSVEQPEKFWQALWNYFEIKASKQADSIFESHADFWQCKWFLGAELNFAENLLARRDQHPALVYYNEAGKQQTLSYLELYQQVAKLSNALRNIGIKAGDRIAGFLPNCPQTIVAMLATASIGATWSACSPDFGIEGVCDRFCQISPKILFTCSEHQYNGKTFDDSTTVNNIIDNLPSLEKIICIDRTNHINNALYLDDFIADQTAECEFTQLPFDHPLYILYSSGTTGKPKCIVHGAGGTLIQHLKELRLHTDLRPSEVVFYYTTCGWMMWNWLVSSLAIGATIVLYDGAPTHPTPDALIKLIEQEQINVFGTSAKYLSAIEKSGVQPNKFDLQSLRMICSTGSPLLAPQYDWVYENFKADLCLASISGGTDIVSCFALGNPMLPVYRGELQCRGLGLAVAVLDESGNRIIDKKGELVCTASFPCMPIYFWNDSDAAKYKAAYFEKNPPYWSHGDYAKLTKHENSYGLVIYGRSDAVLNPGGVRIGTAEIYRQVEKLPEIAESLVVGQQWQDDIRIVLFVKVQAGFELTAELESKIKQQIKSNTSPRHVPSKILQVSDLPRTVSGKIVELAVRNVIHNLPVKNTSALANPEILAEFANRVELQN